MSDKGPVRRLVKSIAYGVASSTLRLPYKDLAWIAEKHRVAAVMKTLAVDLVVDVGANVGQFAQEIRRLGYQGRIVSFEPDPTAFAKLKAALHGDQLWEGHNVGLGRAESELELHTSESSVYNSFLPQNDHLAGLAIDGTSVVKKIKVPVKRLDAFASSLASKSIFLKTDTQGFDLEVIGGAGRILDATKLLMAEVSIEPIYQGMPSFAQSLAEFQRLGFSLLDLYTVTRTGRLGAVLEYDCLMGRA